MTSSDAMTDQTRAMLVQLMESQAYRELAAAHMFGYGLRFVPELTRYRAALDGVP